MSREAMEHALSALELAQTDVHWELNSPTRKVLRKAEHALRAALAEQQCPCGDRPANQCPGEWEPGCDLGENERHAKVAEQPAPQEPVAWMVEGEGLYWTEERAIRRAEQFVDPLEVLPLYTSAPAPQPLTIERQRDALLEALKELTGHANERFTGGVWDRARAAIAAVEEARDRYTTPPAPQPLTDYEVLAIYQRWDETPGTSWADFARAVEREVLRRMGVQP